MPTTKRPLDQTTTFWYSGPPDPHCGYIFSINRQRRRSFFMTRNDYVTRVVYRRRDLEFNRSQGYYVIRGAPVAIELYYFNTPGDPWRTISKWTAKSGIPMPQTWPRGTPSPPLSSSQEIPHV